jgi:hypothetical protein
MSSILMHTLVEKLIDTVSKHFLSNGHSENDKMFTIYVETCWV